MTLEELLKQYDIASLFILIIGLLSVIKYIAELIKWFMGGARNIFKKETDEEQKKKENEERFNKNEEAIKNLIQFHKDTEKKIDKLSNSVQILMDSDKDDIRAWITEQHHKYCYSKSKIIDAYSYQCIKNRYQHYKDEGGNSFIDKMMADIDTLSIYTPEINEVELKIKNKEE